MSQRHTSVADRHRFIDLKLKGHSLQEIAERTGWSFHCIRHWWRRYRDGGRDALDPSDKRKQRGGHMSTFPNVVRFAFLRIKREHPKWGAEVARPRVAGRLGLPEAELPCVSTIEKYWAQYRGRLYKRHRKRSPSQTPGPKPTEPHERWQADFKVKMNVEGLGPTDVFNIRDDASPVKIGSFVYPANEWNERTTQDALRSAFTRWGLCDRLQTDKETRLVNTSSDEPFPSRFTLCLTGLGITHELARSAQENGCAERFNRTWYDRVVEGRTFQDYDELQSTSDVELEWINQKLPSRGRACDDRPPLEAYPQAKHPRRPYTREKELELFSMDRVYEFLAGQHWWRKVSQVGQFSINGQRCGIGTAYANQDVRVTFDPGTIEFVVEDSHGEEIKRFEPQRLTAEEITGLKPDRPSR
jgi:hypothetical protein